MKFNKFVKGGLAAVMAMGMMACSNSGGSATTTTESTGGDAALKLGFSGPLTGDASVYGWQYSMQLKSQLKRSMPVTVSSSKSTRRTTWLIRKRQSPLTTL